MKQEPIQVGEVVRSIQGRDRGRYLVVIDILDDEYVLLTDGDLRRLDRPKKKKKKHFISDGLISKEIQERVQSEKKLNNVLIRLELERLTQREPGSNGG